MKPFVAAVLKSIVVAVVLLTRGGAACAEGTPNIVYILADDLGYGDVQCLNPERGRIKTPHLDRLASQGMTFTDAHSGSSVCTPTRYGLLTGRYAWRTRLQSGVLDGGNDEPLIAAGRLTVGGFLREQGYATACLGKWHLGFTAELPAAAEKPGAGKKGKGKMGEGGLPVGAKIVGGPVTRGFDYFWGCSNARTMSALIENDRVIERIEPVAMLPRLGRRAAEYVNERAAGARAGRPFFLYLPLTAPHTPIVPAAEWQGRSGLGDYGDFVMQTDAVVGEVLAALERNGLTDNTLVIFTADNGCSPAAGTAKLERAGHFASGAFRGYKADIWEGGHRVPFLVRWPGMVAAGSRCAATICHTDLLATVAEMLQVRLPENAGEDSFSFLPELRGTGRTLRASTVHHSIQGRFAIREGNWKLELCAGSGGWGAPGEATARKEGLPEFQLYDLARDVAETNNVQSANAETVQRLVKELQRIVAEGRSTPGARQGNDVAVDIFKRGAGGGK